MQHSGSGLTSKSFQLEDAVVDIEAPVSISEQYFSSDYFCARERFLQTAGTLGANLVDSLFLDSPGLERGGLTIDLAVFGNLQADKLLFHVSGVHGVEGFVGSAIQLALMPRLSALPQNSAIVFVHCLNPYGMLNLRRVNEHNVDLNRNFRFEEKQWASVAPQPYEQYCAVINPHLQRPSQVFSSDYEEINFQKYAQEVLYGQCKYPEGLFFGGNCLERGPELLLEWVQRNFGNCESVFGIDIHSGMGAFAEEILLTGYAPDSPEINPLREVFGRSLCGAPNRYFHNIGPGAFPAGIQRAFAKAEVRWISQEFGTYPAQEVFSALREENFWHHRGVTDPWHRSKRQLLEMFCPASVEWRTSVLERGVGACMRMWEFCSGD